MFYEPDKNDHGLRYNPFKSIIVPRPIGWISTLSAEGVLNLAPFSQCNNLSWDPPYIMISCSERPDGRHKDTVRNCMDTGEFVHNMATYELRDAVNATGQMVEPAVDESALAGLEMIPSKLVKPPRVAASPVNMECKVHSAIVLPGRKGSHHVIIGRVIGVHIRDDALTPEGKLDVIKIRPLARLGYLDYTSVESSFTMRPMGPNQEAFERGMEGRAERPVTAK